MEIKLPCPKCGKDFYVNTSKKVGICFKAKCGYRAGPREISKLVAVGGGTLDLSPQIESGSLAPIVELPDNAHKIVDISDGEYITHFPIEHEKVLARGVSTANQYRFNLLTDGKRIIIPVYYEGTLRFRLERAHWWKDDPYVMRYKYPGGKKSHYLFNWDEMKDKPWLTIVENTFNAIRYKDLINSTTCFGSSLSDEQIKLIARGRARFVIVLFDSGAESKAEQAVNSLKDSGVKAAAVYIKGQPDDYSDSEVRELVYGNLQDY